MALENLKLASLDLLDDGRVAIAWQKQLARAVQDCLDRPGESAARKVTLEFQVIPVQEPDGSADNVRGEFQVKSSIPNQRSKPYEFTANKSGHLVFNVHSPEVIDQKTIFDDE